MGGGPGAHLLVLVADLVLEFLLKPPAVLAPPPAVTATEEDGGAADMTAELLEVLSLKGPDGVLLITAAWEAEAATATDAGTSGIGCAARGHVGTGVGSSAPRHVKKAEGGAAGYMEVKSSNE